MIFVLSKYCCNIGKHFKRRGEVKLSKQHHRFYQSNWFIILMLIFVFPLGIFLMWRYTSWKKFWKISVTVLIALIFLGQVGIANENDQETSHNKTAHTSQHHQSKDKENKKDSDSSKKEESSKKSHKDKSNKHEQDNEKKNNKDQENNKQEDNKHYQPGTTDRIPVKFSKPVDGDTARLIYQGKEEKFRFLLIDTPETKHPRLGKQPFGQEASDRTKELLQNAEQVEVEFDVGTKEDKYQRKLAYIYVDGKMLNEILVREGLAKVAYVYPPNTRYLDRLEKAQEQAKAEKLGIWSLDSAFEDGANNDKASSSSKQNSTSSSDNASDSNDSSSQNDSNSNANSSAASSDSQGSQQFNNCTELRKVYPHGVTQDHPAYSGKLDRDGDGMACEAS